MRRDDAVEALRAGRAYVDLSTWRKVLVRGGEAWTWLNDIVTADLSGTIAGAARRTLVLTPTGRIRADLTATPFEDGVLLLQDPGQPEPIDALLDRYVLSSDVSLEDRTDDLALVAFPGGETPSVEGTGTIRPSVLGVGADVVGPADRRAAIRDAASDLAEAAGDDIDRWRIERGMPRFPIDLTGDSLPHETWLGDAVAYSKGCYLGQEAVAKVRNLGHPPFVVLAATAQAPASVGDRVLVDGSPAGVVTSAAPSGGGQRSATALIVRVRWAARDEQLALADGAPIDVRPSAPR